MNNQIIEWNPFAGETFQNFVGNLDQLSAESKISLERSTQKILGRCTNPESESGKNSVLVVGEVQSGKTLSFTSAIAMARDNNFHVIVVLGGTKNPLLKQTHERLLEDLEVDIDAGAIEWEVIKSPRKKDQLKVIKAIESWHNSAIPFEYRKTCVLLALKNPSSIIHLNDLLTEVQENFDSKISVLIVDDEADQAGLNIKVNMDDESSTYEAITNLRDSLPHHTYLMYTATSQALLLVDLTDHLSPDSVVVLDSGPSYLGTNEIFGDASSKFFVEIPGNELEVATAPTIEDTPPNSLKQALAYFILVVVVTHKRKNPRKTVSMLIHPHAKTEVHGRYKSWVEAILDRWLTALSSDDEEDSLSAFESIFSSSIKEIEKTVNLSEYFPDMHSRLGKLEFIKQVNFWTGHIELRVVNSVSSANAISPKEWEKQKAWIVVGAQNVERGFTIENLAVTYMPRNIGIGAIDTIQQRGRFFGHKAAYKDLLRGWLNGDTKFAFESIVESDNAMRSALKQVDEQRLSLASWKRELIFGIGLQATRAAVISLNHSEFNLSGKFVFKQSQLYHPGLSSGYSEMHHRLKPYIETSVVSTSDNRRTGTKHRISNIEMPELISLLSDWPITKSERNRLDYILIALKYYSDSYPNTDAHLYFMDGLRKRERGGKKNFEGILFKDYKIDNLHQGPNQATNTGGDTDFRTTDAVTVQIHSIAPKHGGEVFPEVLAIAVAWPNGFSRTILKQEEGFARDFIN